MTDRERLIDLIKQAEKEFSDTGKPILEIEEFVADYLLDNGVILPPQPKPQTDLKGKCGSCIYAIPASSGKSRVYVECTNVEHLGQWCKRQISYKRQRTHKGCKRYQERKVF